MGADQGLNNHSHHSLKTRPHTDGKTNAFWFLAAPPTGQLRAPICSKPGPKCSLRSSEVSGTFSAKEETYMHLDGDLSFLKH